MLERVDRVKDERGVQYRHDAHPHRVRHATTVAAVLAVLGACRGALAQSQLPSPALPPSAPPPTAQPPAAAQPPSPTTPGPQPTAPAQPPPVAPGSGGPPNNPPTSSQPPGYPPPQGYPPQQGYPQQQGYPPQQGYPQGYAPQGPPPPPQQPTYGQPQQPTYGQPQQLPPGQPQPQPPIYGQPQPGPGYGYREPPLPPPPQPVTYHWSFRFRLLDLLYGRAAAELEYAFTGPFSFTLIPEYTFADPAESDYLGINAHGGGVAGEIGYWMGRPLRSYFVKAHVGYRSTRFTSYIDQVDVPATQVGAFFGAQSIYGGWFSFSYGIGMVYDLQSKDRTLGALEPGRGAVLVILPASGALGNGFDLLAQLSLGASF